MMKKILILLSLLLTITLSGCSKNTDSADDFSITASKQEIKLGMNIKDVKINNLKTDENNNYYNDDLSISVDEDNLIIGIVVNDKYSLTNGIKAGDNQDKVIEHYGESNNKSEITNQDNDIISAVYRYNNDSLNAKIEITVTNKKIATYKISTIY